MSTQTKEERIEQEIADLVKQATELGLTIEDEYELAWFEKDGEYFDYTEEVKDEELRNKMEFILHQYAYLQFNDVEDIVLDY